MNKSKYLSIIFSILFFFLSFTVYADMSGPGDPGGGPMEGDPPLGGGASVGGGVIVLLFLGISYGGKKIYDLRDKKIPNETD